MKRPLVGALVGFLLFAAGYQAVTSAYYYFMPGNWWVNYYYAHADNLTVGEDVALTLCRDVHYDNFKLEATRTFVYQLDNGRTTELGEYDFMPTINDSDNRCQTLQIPASRQPQEPGLYEIRTTATFYIEGNRKTISYSTNKYQLTDTAKSLEDRIDAVQRELDDLKGQRTTD